MGETEIESMETQTRVSPDQIEAASGIRQKIESLLGTVVLTTSLLTASVGAGPVDQQQDIPQGSPKELTEPKSRKKQSK